MTEKRHESTRIMGLRPCPKCSGGQNAECDYCDSRHFVTVDRYDDWYFNLANPLPKTDPELPEKKE